jgi:nucleotide-binding universal stress UspA family protein
MTLKTILVHVDLSRHAPARIRAAAALANAHGACLLGLAVTGIPRAVFPDGDDVQPHTLAESHFEPLVDRARQALASFEAIVRETRTSFDTRLVRDVASDALAQMARFADLVVVSPHELGLPETLVQKSARPVLVMPLTDPVLNLAPDALVAWNGSEAASLAVSAALPLLQGARTVTVATLIDAGWNEADCRLEQADLLAYLGRHGIDAASITAAASATPGADLLRLADEHGHDLLVMGCDGRTRWRDPCLGAVSRTVLAEAGMPVLLAH